MRIFEIAGKNRARAAGRVYCTRAILILYLRIQYHFSAASRQTGANRRKNVFVVDALIWESVAFYRGDISFKRYHSRIFILSGIFTSHLFNDVGQRMGRGIRLRNLCLLNAIVHVEFCTRISVKTTIMTNRILS